MRSMTGLFLILLFAASQPAFAQSAPSGKAAPKPRPDPVQTLREDLDRLFSDPRTARAQVGIEVLSLDREEVLYERNRQRLLIPASSNKIIAACVALIRLGGGYRFETRALADGPVENGILKGNLILAGSGDPTYSSKFHEGDPFAPFRIWAARLKEKGIQKISGSLLGDEGAFGESALGQGWEWNDLSNAFAAPVGALQFNDNTITVIIKPGPEPGNPASIRTAPLEDYLRINNQTVTGSGGTPADIRIRNSEPGETIDVSGAIPAKGTAIPQNVAIRRPSLFFLSALRYILSSEGIAVDKIGMLKQARDPGTLSLLWTHTSPELSEIIKPLLKNSLNLYAETLVRALGLHLRGEGTFAKGKEIVEETLEQVGIMAGTYSYADGSGLSRLNLQSAESFVRLLKFMHQDKSFGVFYDALPIAGVDGTLSGRMSRTYAENNVRAKTGSLANVSSISGYLNTADGEMLAFSVALNGYIGPRDVAESIQDKALVRLAGFSRKPESQKPHSGNPKKNSP